MGRKDEMFWMESIEEKDWCKIFLHMHRHPIGGIKPVTKHATEEWINVEVYPFVIVSYYPFRKRVLISTAKENVEQIKEMFYHWLQCSCEINKTINETETFADALKVLGVKT